MCFLTVAAALLNAQNIRADGKHLVSSGVIHLLVLRRRSITIEVTSLLSSQHHAPAQHWLTGTDPCVAATLNMVSVCGSFVTKVQNDAKLLGAATDAQIKGAASQGVQPSTQ